MKKKLSLIPIMLASAFVLYYFLLPACNIHDIRFWIYIIVLLVELLLLTSFKELKNAFSPSKVKEKTSLALLTRILLGVVVCALLYIFVVPLIFSPLFMSSVYARRISVEEVSFSEIPSYNFNTTAIIDRDSSEKLGDKVMGQMTDLVSQFSVSDEYSQISYEDSVYRVTPLAYDGFVKYLKNRSSGIPGYIIVSSTTGEASLVRTEKKMRYVPSAYFNENLMRKLRFSHPFAIFGSPSFEIDEEGNPYYVCTTYTYHGCDTLKKVTGVIIFDPISGESEQYSIEDAPSWVDRIYPESLVTTELDDYGKYQKGFINSFLTQEGVIQTSEGYNYISKDGDIWLYTGMTSVVSDQSNVGFMLVNLRTHEAQKITTSGADEYSVMDSAEGEVLNYGYEATFPVLVNVDNEPFYILSLKDSAGLVKMYAMVDAKDYQQVYTIKADKDTKTAIDELIQEATGRKVLDISSDSLEEKTITIEDISSVQISGNTVFYILSSDEIYSVTVSEENASEVVFLHTGDSLKVKYYQDDSGVRVIREIGQ